MLLGYNEASKYIKMCLASTIEIIILMTNQGRSSRISTNLNLIKRFGILYGPMHLIMYMHIYHIYIVLWMQCLNQKKTKTKNKHCLSSKPHKEVWNTLWSHALMYMHIYHIYIVLECSVSTKKNKKQTLFVSMTLNYVLSSISFMKKMGKCPFQKTDPAFCPIFQTN